MLLEEVSGFSFRDEILSEIQLLLLKSFIYLFFFGSVALLQKALPAPRLKQPVGLNFVPLHQEYSETQEI